MFFTLKITQYINPDIKHPFIALSMITECLRPYKQQKVPIPLPFP